MNTFQPVVLALIRKNNKYLLTLRKDDNTQHDHVWQIPGGGLEFGETPEDGVRREIREELGIEIMNLQLVPSIEISVRGSWQGLFIVFVCEMADSNQEILLNNEAYEYGFFTYNEAVKLPLLKGCVEMLDTAEKLKER